MVRLCSRAAVRRASAAARIERWTLLVLTALATACSSISPPPHYVQDTRFPQAGSTFGTVSWVTFDTRLGNVIVLQRATPPVTFWTPAGRQVGQWNTDQLGFPHSLTLRPEAGGQPSVWITDMAPPLLAGTVYGHCVKQFTFGGQMVSTIGTCGENTEGTGLDPLQFDKVTDIAFFAAGNLTFITDGDIGGLNNRTLTLDAAGRLIAVWSAPNNQPGSGPLQFNLPHAVELDDCKRLWIVDSLNSRVQVTTPNGQFLGQLACFDTNQTHDIAMVRLTPKLTRVWVTTGVAGTASGTVSIFDIPSSCDQPPVLDCNALVASFTVPLPPNNPTAMLHSIAVDPATQDVYLALLGDNLPPQKWMIQKQP
jgi:hypothetical protein